MTRRTGNEGLHTRVVQDKRERVEGQEAMRLADLDRENAGAAYRKECEASDIARDEVIRLRALLARCAAALEAVPDPSAAELELIAEAKRG
jgi:hypothetical protein